MNNCTFIGRLTSDVEIRTSNSGTAVGRFKIAVDRAFKDANGERQADFIPCIAFKKTAETISKYFAKGSKIAVIGAMQSGSYTAKDGTKRYTLDLIVEKFFFVEKASQRQQESPPQMAPDNSNYAPAPLPDDPGPCPIPDDGDVPLPFDI